MTHRHLTLSGLSGGALRGECRGVVGPSREHRLDRGGRHWPGVVVALGKVTVHCGHGIPLTLTLDTFGDDGQAEDVGKLRHGCRDRRTYGCVVDVGDEPLVDLDDVDRQPAQVVQRGVAGAEVVQRKAKPLHS